MNIHRPPPRPGKDQRWPYLWTSTQWTARYQPSRSPEAHRADLETQGRYGVDYRQYWVDEEHGRIFCLVEAPDADAAISVHREAHGLVADAVFPVAEGS